MSLSFETAFTGFQIGSKLRTQPADTARVLSVLCWSLTEEDRKAVAREVHGLGSPAPLAQFLRDLADDIDATPSNDNQLPISA